MSLRVLEPGFRSTLQDAGRFGHLRAGVPPSGPADEVAFEAAQRLVGNGANDAAIEIVGLPFRFALESARLVAVTGRDVRLRTRGVVEGWTAVFARAGEEVAVEGTTRYAYLAVSGGFAAEPVLGSRSTYLPAAIGPLPRPLSAADVLPLGAARRGAESAGRSARPIGRPRIAVTRGPHAERCDLATLLASGYRVSEKSDRMGVRLVGPAVRGDGREILSLGVAKGAVQITHGGQPIVLLADHQTTGGYPVAAVVVRAHLPALAQALPGEPVSFYEMGRDEALGAWRDLRAWLEAID